MVEIIGTVMTMDKIYNLCNSNRWYTCGNNRQYDNLLENCEKMTLEEIAKDIYLASFEIPYDFILLKLKGVVKKGW